MDTPKQDLEESVEERPREPQDTYRRVAVGLACALYDCRVTLEEAAERCDVPVKALEALLCARMPEADLRLFAKLEAGLHVEILVVPAPRRDPQRRRRVVEPDQSEP
jgi:hypothetical protein